MVATTPTQNRFLMGSPVNPNLLLSKYYVVSPVKLAQFAWETP